MEDLKAVTLLVVALIIWQLFELWRLGRKLTVMRHSNTISQHKNHVACVGFLTFIAVCLIEYQVRMSPAPYEAASWLFVFHGCLDTLLVFVFFAIILRFTGKHNPRVHRYLAYSFFSLYVLVAISGLVLLYRLPSPA